MIERTKRTAEAIVICLVVAGAMATLIAMLGGCAAAGMPVRWQPTEQQRQAADLATRDAAALAGRVDPVAEPIRSELEQAARITQTYMGLPASPLPAARLASLDAAGRPVVAPPDAAKDAALAQAGQDAMRPPPSPEDLVAAGFGIAEILTTGVSGVLGTLGCVVAARKVAGWRGQIDEHRDKAQALRQAVEEIVRGIQQLPDDLRSQVTQAQSGCQSQSTEAIVASVKHPA